MTKIPTVKIEFHFMPDFVLSEEQYAEEGKFIGLIKAGCFQMKDVKKVHHILLEESKYPKTQWEG